MTEARPVPLRGRPGLRQGTMIVLDRWSLPLATALALTSCGRAPAAPARVDETLTPREARVQGFQTGLPETRTLADGVPSRDSLIAIVAHGIETRDTAALRRLAITKAEFAWLVYPTSAQGLPPYDLEPQAYWEMLFLHSNGGITKALEAYGGAPLRVLSYDCGTGESVEGENRLVGPCLVRRVTPGGDTVQEALLAQLIERNGRWKVMSYANKLD